MNEALDERLKEMLRLAGDGAYVSAENKPRAHRQVMQIAKEMCLALYEQFAKNDEFYKAWPNAYSFAKQFWPHFCDEARATMAKILASNENQGLKDSCYDALIKDHSLAPSRKNVPQVRMDI